MFYTKYRPQKFSEIIKPNEIAVALMNQVKSKKTAHAYLLVGPRGIGKTTTARILAKAFNCKKIEKNGDPCDKCENCIAIREGRFLDLIEIDAASNRGIDDIRDLRNKVSLAPSVGKAKVYIIDEVHMLTLEAFNALLKTLEEPPAHCTFILCTTEFHKVPDTIKSRCQVFKFKRATIKQLVSKLQDIADSEKVEITKKDLERIARAASGGFRDAETMLQQIIEGDTDVGALLSIVSRDDFSDFVNFIVEKDSSSALRFVSKVFEDGVDLYIWVGELIKYLRDLLFVKVDAYEGLLDVTDDVLEQMKEQAAASPVEFFISAVEAFVKAQNAIKEADLPQLPLEISVVRLCGNAYSSGSDSASNPPVDSSGDTDIKDFSDSNSSVDEVDSSKLSTKSSKKEENKSSISLDFSLVQDKWGVVLANVMKFNNSIQALLKACTPVDVKGNSIVLEAVYAFHKERLESPKNRKIVETVLADIFGPSTSIKCKLSKERPKKRKFGETGNLTDRNIEIPAGVPENAALVEIFDGGLPL